MLTYSFHISKFISFPEKNPSFAQFLLGLYNKIIIKFIGYFWGVTTQEVGVVEEKIRRSFEGLVEDERYQV